MGYDFGAVIDRRRTNCVKYDFAVQRGMPEDALPLWIADMDFAAPPCVLEALERAVKHGVFGYADTGASYFDAVRQWMLSRHGYGVKPSWLLKTPGVVFAVAAGVRAFTRKGDAVLVQQPVYYPFRHCIESNGRVMVDNTLRCDGGRYTIDFEDFERRVAENAVKLFILCSPHNPVGRVWTADELTRMGDICLRHGVTVLSDEIHMDFVYHGHKHIPFASLKPEFERIAVTCTAPSKTFNLAGLQMANIFIADEGLRRAYKDAINRTGYGQPNVMGMVSSEAAYRGGAAWLDELLAYLEGNMRLVREFLSARIPRVKLVEPEGTYLAWLDCSALGMDDKRLDGFMARDAKVWLDGGTMFGRGGEGFQRVNVACPQSTLEAALNRIADAVDRL